MYLFVTILPNVIGLEGADVSVSMKEVASSVAIYLGIPFIAGFITRVILEKKKSEIWYKENFVPSCDWTFNRSTSNDRARKCSIIFRKEIF